MTHGGKRNGSGRKANGENRKQRPKAKQAALEGPLPADMILFTARWHFKAKRYDEAARVAAMVAQYYHPRLNAVSVGGDQDNPVPITFVEVAASDAPTTD